jgi:hypothetical protein
MLDLAEFEMSADLRGQDINKAVAISAYKEKPAALCELEWD